MMRTDSISILDVRPVLPFHDNCARAICDVIRRLSVKRRYREKRHVSIWHVIWNVGGKMYEIAAHTPIFDLSDELNYLLDR